MSDAWPAICTLIGLLLLLALIIRWQISAFVAVLVASLAIGLAAGMSPGTVVETVGTGIGKIMKEVTVILALGAMLGRILEASGGAEIIAQRFVDAFGQKRASLALLCASFLVGLPILFNVGFLVLIPIVYRLQKQTGQSLLYFLLPMSFSLGITHSLVPPHPGIVIAVEILSGARTPPPLPGTKADAQAPAEDAEPPVNPEAQPTPPNQVMVQTILFGALMSLPLTLFGWYGPGRWWARRQHVETPEALAGLMTTRTSTAPASFPAALAVVTLPLLLSLFGFGAELLEKMRLLPEAFTRPMVDPEQVSTPLKILTHTPLAWLKFLGTPSIALLVSTGLAFWLLGVRQGMDRGTLAKIADKALQDVGSILFLFGAAGGFKEIIEATGAGRWIADTVIQLPLSKIATAYLVAAMVRVALGSATASIVLASSLLAGVARTMPGQETLLILAVANGVTFMTQPADSGFWMIKEYGNVSVRDVMLKFNLCRISMSLAGLGILLLYEAYVM